MRYITIAILLIIANINSCLSTSSGYWGLPNGRQLPCGAVLPNDVKSTTKYLKHRYTFEEQYGDTSSNVANSLDPACLDKASISGSCYKWLMWRNGISGPANVSMNKIESYFYSDNAEYSFEIIGANLNNINVVYGSQTVQTTPPRIAISNNIVRIEQSGSVIANVPIGMYQNISGIVISYFTNRDGPYMPGFQSRVSVYVSALNTGNTFVHVQNVTRIGNPIASIPSIMLSVELPHRAELHRVSLWADQYDANLLTLSSRTNIRNCNGQCVAPSPCDDAIPIVQCSTIVSQGNNPNTNDDVCETTIGYISRSTGSPLNCTATFNVTQSPNNAIISGPVGVSSYATIPGTNLTSFRVTSKCNRVDDLRWYVGQRCASAPGGNVGYQCMNATNQFCDAYLGTIIDYNGNGGGDDGTNNSTLPCMNCNNTLVSDVYVSDSVSVNASIVVLDGMNSLVSFNVTYITYNNTGLIINFAPNNTNSVGSCDFSAPQTTNGWTVFQNFITTDNVTGASIASRSIVMNITLNSLLNCTNFFGVQAFTSNDLGNGTILFSGVLGADAVYFDNVTNATVTRFNSIFQVSFTVVAAGSSQSVGFFVRQLNSVSAAWFQDSWMATPGNTITPHLVLRTSTDSDLYLSNPVIINNTGIVLTMISSNTQPCTVSNSMCYQYWSMMGSALPSNQSFTVNGYVEIRYSVCSTTSAFHCAKSIIRIRLFLSRSSKVDSKSISLNANLTMYNSTNLDSVVYSGQTIINNCPLCALLSLNVHDADTSNFNLRVQTVELCYSSIAGVNITSCADPNAAKILLFNRQMYYVNPLYQLTFITMPVLTKPSQSLFCFMLHIQHSSSVYLNVTWNAGYTSPGLFFVNSMLTHTFRSVRHAFSGKDLMYMKPTLHSSASVSQQAQSSDGQSGSSKYHGYSAFEFFGEGCGPHDMSCSTYAYGYCFMYWCDLDISSYFLYWLLLISILSMFIVCCCLYPSWIYDDYQYAIASFPASATILPTSSSRPRNSTVHIYHNTEVKHNNSSKDDATNIYLNNTNNNTTSHTENNKRNTSVRNGREYNNNHVNSHNNRSHIDSNSHKDHSHRDTNSHNNRSHIDSNSHRYTYHDESNSEDEFNPEQYKETHEIHHKPKHRELKHKNKRGKEEEEEEQEEEEQEDDRQRQRHKKNRYNDSDTDSTDTDSTETESEEEEEEDYEDGYNNNSRKSSHKVKNSHYMEDYGDDSILEKIKGYFSKKQKKY